jgi:hypothetical protein
MSLTSSAGTPQPSLAWQFESSNVDSVTGLAPAGGTFTPSALQAVPTYVSGKYGKAIQFNNNVLGNTANSYIYYNLNNTNQCIFILCMDKSISTLGNYKRTNRNFNF